MPNVPYFHEVNGKLVTGYGSLIPICSLLSNSSLLPSLTLRDFCLVQPGRYWKKSIMNLITTFEGSFFIWAKKCCCFFKTFYIVASALKSWIILGLHNISFMILFIFLPQKKTNTQILHKSLLIQDWVFRLDLELLVPFHIFLWQSRGQTEFDFFLHQQPTNLAAFVRTNY